MLCFNLEKKREEILNCICTGVHGTNTIEISVEFQDEVEVQRVASSLNKRDKAMNNDTLGEYLFW